MKRRSFLSLFAALPFVGVAFKAKAANTVEIRWSEPLDNDWVRLEFRSLESIHAEIDYLQRELPKHWPAWTEARINLEDRVNELMDQISLLSRRLTNLNAACINTSTVAGQFDLADRERCVMKTPPTLQDVLTRWRDEQATLAQAGA